MGRRLPPAYTEAIKALDASPASVALEFEEATVKLTHLEKVLWPADERLNLSAYTRRDYMRYLLQVAPHLLTHIRDRPLTLIRHPEGIAGRRFVHFHYEQKLPRFVETVDIYSEKAGEAEQYLLCNNAPTLLWLAHVGCLEFHAWHSRTTLGRDATDAGSDYASSAEGLEGSGLNRPDYIVCDLDPYIYAGSEARGAQPEFSAAAFERCKEVASVLKGLLESMGLKSLVKTSGRTGLHVLVPIARTITYDATRAVATTLGRHLMAQKPKLITMEQSVTKRTGKIFFDAGMNARVKTLSAPYSPRAALGAPVSMPIEWENLADAKPLDYTMATVPGIVNRHGDLWAGVLDAGQDVAAVLRGL
jgi:bifunctional non-homologous end joining protein LigD